MISVNNVSFTYPGADQKVLHDLSFDINKGEIFGFLGPSGAGKSTTQKLLYKILNGYHGAIEIDGKSLGDWGSEYFELIGVGFELPNHYLKLTGRENLKLFGSFYKSGRLLETDHLFELVGLNDCIDDKVETYSKGMKMRLNYIRAIMHQPDILFFDEPTAGLDPISAHKIKTHIKQLKQEGKTIFITTHDMSTADELCDRVSFIVDGSLRLTEKPSVLKHKHGQDKVNVVSKNSNSAEFPLEQLGENAGFLKFIKDNDILSIKTAEATLEEVFIEVTGKTLIP